MTAGSSSTGFELVDHTAETTLRLRAPTLAELVGQATRGVLSLVPERVRDELADGWRAFDVDGGDPSATLVEWINEMVFRAEAESWLPAEPEVEAVGESGVHIRCKVLRLREPFVLVKAATLHGAEIHQTDDTLQVEITLDI